jgi:hypothetical protein
MQRANPRAFRRAFRATSLVSLVLLTLVLLDPEARYDWGYITGRLIWTTLMLPGLIVGMLAHFSSRRWGRGRFAVAVIGAEFFSLLLASASALSHASGGY